MDDLGVPLFLETPTWKKCGKFDLCPMPESNMPKHMFKPGTCALLCYAIRCHLYTYFLLSQALRYWCRMSKIFGGAETGRRTHISFHFLFEGSSGEQQGE